MKSLENNLIKMNKSQGKFAVMLVIIIITIMLGMGHVHAENENVVSIGDKQYSDIKLAISEVKEGETIKLLADVYVPKIDGMYVADLPDNVTLDLNEHIITVDYMSFIPQGNNLTIKNGTIKTSSPTISYALFIGDERGTSGVVIEDVTLDGGINVYNTINVTLRNVNVTGHDYYAVWGDAGSQIIIESGTYTNQKEGSKTDVLLGMSTSHDVEPAFVIKGGTFITNFGKLALGEGFHQPIIYGGTFNCDIEQYKANEVTMVQNENGEYVVGYKIEISNNDTTGGNINTLNNVIGAGSKVEITFQANEGYKLKSIAVVDSNGNNIEVSSDNTFTMPESNVTITPTFEEYKTEVEVPEIDITTGAQEIKAGIDDRVQTEETIKKTLEKMMNNDATLAGNLSNADITLAVEVDNNVEVVDEVKNNIETEIKNVNNNAKIIDYFDIGISVKANGTEITKLSELTNTISLIATLPENLEKVQEGYIRTYYVIREHNGEISVLEAKLSEDGKYLTFESDKFSTFALAYIDEKVEEPNNAENNDTSNNVNPEDNGKAEQNNSNAVNNNQGNNINTGDNIMFSFITLLIAIVGICGLCIIRKRNISKKH